MTKKTTPVHTIGHRGLKLRQCHDGYMTAPGSPVRVEAFRADDGKWLATIPVGDNGDSTGDGDAIGSAIDDALGMADRDLTDAIRSLTAERARIRRVMRAKS